MAKELYGLVGHPVRHSLSPAMQNAAFREIGIDAEYLLHDIRPENLVSFLENLRSSKIAGLNVTIPHKIKTKEYLEHKGSLDENARKLGAVNTIKVTPDGLCGFNTDGPGFYRSLVEDLACESEGKTIFILGAGGASHAIALYLGDGPRHIFVSDIDKEKAGALKEHYAKFYKRDKFEIIAPKDYPQVMKKAHLIINATPIGMKVEDPSPIDTGLLRPGQYVYDLVYNRPMTQLVKSARIAKCHATTGLGMLLYQGAIAFEIWAKKPAPIAVMKKALREALKSQSNDTGYRV